VRGRFYPDETVARLGQFVETHGYIAAEHRLLYSFPSKSLSLLDQQATLQEAGLHKESIHVQSVAD
jgi:hypothetical protein